MLKQKVVQPGGQEEQRRHRKGQRQRGGGGGGPTPRPCPTSNGAAAKASPTSSSCAVKRPGGIASIMNVISRKKQKMGCLDKSKLDWNKFVKEEGIKEELETHNKGKDGSVSQLCRSLILLIKIKITESDLFTHKIEITENYLDLWGKYK